VSSNMRRPVRTLVVAVLLSALVSLLTFVSAGTANADSAPPLQFPAVNANPFYANIVTSPAGEVTIGCSKDGAQDLTTYSATGAIVRQIPRTSQIDGVDDCIQTPAVDKNGVVYGQPYSQTRGVYGPNLLAYSGNTLEWKYPLTCGSSGVSVSAVGANGNIYALARFSDGVHLIGIAPDLAAGQTVPAKVLDIKVADDCNMTLRPYKDGIVLHGQATPVRYYSYSGAFLGETNGNIFSEKLNAEGQLFNFSYTAGSYTSASVSMYNPATGTTAWTTVASTPGANVSQVQSLQPLPGGGVAVLLLEQKMVSGVPAVPTEYVYTVATLNGAGQKVRAVTYINQDGQGTKYGNIAMLADSSGKLILVRELTVPSGISYPSTIAGISISATDLSSGAVTYTGALSGTTGASAHGYRSFYAGDNGPTTGPNTLYLMAACSGNCTDFHPKLYPITVTGIGVEYPRGAFITRAPRPSAAYVALGDSFSSGEGVPPFEASTNIDGVNVCHRSTVAYARLIAGTSAKIPSLGATGFRACSGAVTTNVTDLAQWNEGIQLDWWPDTATRLVTLTIGGNDIKFSDFGSACFFSTCDVGSVAYNNSLNLINNELPSKLEATYKRILAYAPNAKIYVLGYPQVVANKLSNYPDDIRCAYLQDGNTKWGDARAARDIVTQLDAKIGTVVKRVQGLNSDNTRLTYVPMDGSDSPFIGHEICGTSSTSWFQNVDQATNDIKYVFHPNDLGQQEYSTVAGAAINAG